MGGCFSRVPQEPISSRAGTASEANRSKKKRKHHASHAQRFVALWNYAKGSKAELDLRKGDVLLEMDEECDAGPEWLFVTQVTGEQKGTGYVPRRFVARMDTIETEPWFFGEVTRPEAELVLQPFSEGTFIVRTRTTGDEVAHALAVRYQTSVKHYKIIKAHNGHVRVTDRNFVSISEMIIWYQRKPEGICCLLTNPPPRPEPAKCQLSADIQKRWREIARSEITIECDLGKGEFGVVRKGIWRPADGVALPVAVKELKPGIAGQKRQFLLEAVAMKNLMHDKLVKLYGVVSNAEPFWIVSEFVKDGQLRQYLRKRSKDGRWMEETHMVDTAAQVADGMRYLETKKVVHRDLAARNVLVEERIGPMGRDMGVNAKVADFGMAQMMRHADMIQAKGRLLLAIKWTAPEALKDLLFSSASDVWSFGILLCEIFTHGSEPYKGMGTTETRRYVLEDRKLIEKPEGMPEKVYNLVRHCCEFNPDQRPTFQQVHEALDKYYTGSNPYERYRQ